MKTQSLIIRTAFFILILLLSQAGLESCRDKVNESPLTKEDILVSFMNNTQIQMQAPGWMLGIKTPKEFYEVAEGKANLNDGTDMHTDELVRIGSITKTFTATLVLILCDEGILHLNEKLESYYPNFLNADKVSIRQLLKHTSGMVSWDEDDDIRNQIFNNTGDWTIDKLIDWASTQPFHFDPGTGFHYSNIGYFLLGKIIEQSTGSTVASLIQEKISVPLKLSKTFMAEDPHPVGDVVHGYDGSSGSVVDMTGTPQADAINYKLAWTAGGMLSTIDDLTVWSRALVYGKLLSDSLHKQQLPKPEPPSQHNPYWSGYGMGISQTDVWFGHTGAVCGYICNMSYNIKDDVTIITFFNKFSAFDLDANTADIGAVVSNFMELARFMCPETLKPTSSD